MMAEPPTLSDALSARRARALRSLDGLSVGDGFGDRFFSLNQRRIAERLEPAPPWLLTDDSIMAASIVRGLLREGEIDQDKLAARFARQFVRDPGRGYGGTARKILTAIDRGVDWRNVTRDAFHGVGSCGNGSAMRVAPLGAYFADDLAKVAEQAALSAMVTHAHPDGISGAIAVAHAAALQARGEGGTFGAFLEAVAAATPAGKTQQGVVRALALGPDARLSEAVAALGNGSEVTCQRTVPFCLWVAARLPHDFPSALWETATAGGDIDTNCAIVGGIVAAGDAAIPADWLAAREGLDAFLGALPR